MNRINLLTMQAFASVFILFLSACAEEPLGGNNQTEGGHTVSLRLTARVAPIPETKASIKPVNSGREAGTAGFYCEMVSSDAVTPGFNVDMESTTPDSVVLSLGTKTAITKAPATLKNVYALLFTGSGAFNGRAHIGMYTEGKATDITFTNVVTPTATNCRLVIVANDNAAAIPYASTGGTGGFDNFSGNYAAFQKLTIASEISKDEDVPYAGSATVHLSLNETGGTVDVLLCRTLAKITLNNHTFNITGGPARSSITLYNAGERRFATPGNDNYNGTGTTETTAFVASTAGSNANSVTWYVGENIQPAVAGIQTPADRNSSKAPANACYIRVASATQPAVNTSPKIGEEYIESGTKSFTYDFYLGRSSDKTDFSLRRHTNYTINSEISGTLAGQEQLALADGRVTLARPQPAGLAIGRFGGPSGFTKGTGSSTTISGSYEKMLLLEPNTSRTTETDHVKRAWGTEGTQYQTETRKYWDRTYIYGITTGGTVGGMSTAAGSLYDYCYRLTLGGVTEGTWYVPTLSQLEAMWTVYGGIKENGGYYAAFKNDRYQCCTEYYTTVAWSEDFAYGTAAWNADIKKSKALQVRCVRDSPASGTASYATVLNGYPLIDLTELTPLGCVFTNSEALARRTAVNSHTPSNEALGVGGNSFDAWNAKMPLKLQVMRANHSVGEVDWAAAYTACKQYASEGGAAGEWRLPSQREIQMIWVLQPQLLGKGSFTALNSAYWIFTEFRPADAWSFNGDNGYLHYRPKKDQYGVRCVRDIV